MIWPWHLFFINMNDYRNYKFMRKTIFQIKDFLNQGKFPGPKSIILRRYISGYEWEYWICPFREKAHRFRWDSSSCSSCNLSLLPPLITVLHRSRRTFFCRIFLPFASVNPHFLASPSNLPSPPLVTEKQQLRERFDFANSSSREQSCFRSFVRFGEGWSLLTEDV